MNILTCPHDIRWRIELDAAQVYPDDPGAGTPAMVCFGANYSSTYWCAVGEEELLSEDCCRTMRIPARVVAWLLDKEDAIADFLAAAEARIAAKTYQVAA
jgi:hypothetical protein